MKPLNFARPLLVGIAAMSWLVMPQMAAAQGPIVVLEYPGYASDSTSGLNRDNPFVYDPNHTASHRVQPDETLSHIITAYYAGSGLVCRSCRWPSSRKTNPPSSAATPISYMLTSCCTCRH